MDMKRQARKQGAAMPRPPLPPCKTEVVAVVPWQPPPMDAREAPAPAPAPAQDSCPRCLFKRKATVGTVSNKGKQVKQEAEVPINTEKEPEVEDQVPINTEKEPEVEAGMPSNTAKLHAWVRLADFQPPAPIGSREAAPVVAQIPTAWGGVLAILDSLPAPRTRSQTFAKLRLENDILKQNNEALKKGYEALRCCWQRYLQMHVPEEKYGELVEKISQTL